MQHRMPTLLSSLAVGITLAGAALVLIGSEAKARPAGPVPIGALSTMETANRKIQAIFDKNLSGDKPSKVELSTLSKQVRELIKEGEIRNGADYALASSILSKTGTLQDALLSHDLAVCSLALGYNQSKALVASSQDLLLAKLGQKQRFGTQSGNGKINPVDSEVSDSMRFIMGVPTLRESKERIAKGQKFVPSIKSMTAVKPKAVAVVYSVVPMAQ